MRYYCMISLVSCIELNEAAILEYSASASLASMDT